MATEFGHFHDAGISCLKTTDDASMLVSASLDSTVALWDVRRPKDPQVVLRGTHRDAVNVCEVFDHYVLSGGDDRNLLVWDVRSPAAPVASARDSKDGINCLAFCAAGEHKVVISGCDDGCLYYHSAADLSGRLPLLGKIEACSDTVNDIVVHPSRPQLWVAGEDASLRCWALPPPGFNSTAAAAGECEEDDDEEEKEGEADEETKARRAAGMVSSMDEFSKAVNHLHIDNDLAYCAVAEYVLILPLAVDSVDEDIDPTILQGGHTDYVRGMQFASNDVLYTAGDDGQVVQWNRREHTVTSKLVAHEDCIMALALSKDGTSLFTGSEDQTIKAHPLPLTKLANQP